MPTTKWSLVARLRGKDTVEAKRALDDLCRAYHYPLYCYLRRRPLSHQDAEDVLHEFFDKLLKQDSFGVADSQKGRLRTYLSAALQRFVETWQPGAQRPADLQISLESLTLIVGAERRYEQDQAAQQESPDRLYDRQWVQELLRLTVERLSQHYAKKNKTALFEMLRPVLLAGGSLASDEAQRLSAELGMRPGALRTAVSRLLEDYRQALRQEILQTVDDHDEGKAELGQLMAVFAGA